MSEDTIIGIDLGTTNSLVGVVDSGFPILLADRDGDRAIPSAVSYAADGALLVGKEALRQKSIRPEETITSVKRWMGRRFSELADGEIAESRLTIRASGSDGIVLHPREGLDVTPEEVSAEILLHLKTIAEEALETSVSRAVITVPAYFNNAQREATKRAAERAGLAVERILNEPTAAALAYGLDKLDDNQTVAVYDLGGGTFDLSILQMQDGIFEVISTAGDTQLGGDEIDAAVAAEIGEKLKLGELSNEQSAILLAIAREAKEALSTGDAYTFRLPFFVDGESYETTLSRTEFEAIAGPIIDRTGPICRRAFAEAKNKGAETIDHLILVGGSTRTPLVRERLKTWLSLEPNLSQHPDEAIALGAAIQAGILSGAVRSVVLVDVTPLSLGIETFGGLMNVIIPRNSTIPTKAGEMFTNAVANQESMAIRVLQGEREMARDNWLLGEVEVPFSGGQKGSARVGVQFSLDSNGILEVLARDTETGDDHILEIKDSAVDVDDVAVENMVSESIDHAFDDMNERVWTEARMKSEELLPAVAAALEIVGDIIPAEDRDVITTVASEVRTIVDSGQLDVAALKQANQRLDDATQNLAALLVEAAFDEST